MFDGKLKVEKVELVKRIIRQNNYHQYEKNHAMCVELGLHVNRTALDRFADKLELIDRAELAKRQNRLEEIEAEKQVQRMQRAETQAARSRPQPSAQRQASIASAETDMFHEDVSSPSHPVVTATAQNTAGTTSHREVSIQGIAKETALLKQATMALNESTRALKPSAPVQPKQKMTYEEVKKREQEITFQLGELKIRETELLQELINLSSFLDTKDVN